MNSDPLSPKIYELKKDKILILLLILSIIIQVIFLLVNVIGFECDAAMFYNYAKAIILIGRSASDYRPPAFPLFLLMTGQVWPGTFLVTLLCQSLMGVIMPILVYKVLKHFGNSLAFVGAIFIIFSTISYNYSTLMLSDQLFGFTFLLSIYFFTNFFFEKDDSDFRWFLVISLVCTFTRWEGIFLLINGYFREY
jgi:dolichyl-phosphate-mannose--protein O-mannosyl transferase